MSYVEQDRQFSLIFFNLNASVFRKDLGKKDNEINVFLYFLYPLEVISQKLQKRHQI
jgi:hypothetical protein